MKHKQNDTIGHMEREDCDGGRGCEIHRPGSSTVCVLRTSCDDEIGRTTTIFPFHMTRATDQTTQHDTHAAYKPVCEVATGPIRLAVVVCSSPCASLSLFGIALSWSDGDGDDSPLTPTHSHSLTHCTNETSKHTIRLGRPRTQRQECRQRAHEEDSTTMTLIWLLTPPLVSLSSAHSLSTPLFHYVCLHSSFLRQLRQVRPLPGLRQGQSRSHREVGESYFEWCHL